MIINHYTQPTRTQLKAIAESGKTIGLVPTMGALHEGHLSLIRQARQENDFVVCSIFVNPIQFNNPEDLQKYPRTLEQDLQLLEGAGCDFVFAPEADDLYPEKVTKTYHFGPLEQVMEGPNRPGHFNGVAIVVHRLFEISHAQKAYFGEKDFQQLAIIKQLVKQESLPIKIIGCPIVREADGLAMSSRNRRLDQTARSIAPNIYRLLKHAQAEHTHHSPASLEAHISQEFAKNPAFDLEYFKVADSESLQPLTQWSDATHAVACVAVFLGNVRLIDNIVLF